MGGTNDEIKGPGFLIIGKIGHQMLLEAEFHAKEQLDPAFIEGFDPLKFSIIRSGIQVEADIVVLVRIIHVQMIGKAHGFQAKRDAPTYHIFHGRLAVAGKSAVQVTVCNNHGKFLLE